MPLTPCDLNTGNYNLYMYTDITQNQTLGDGYSPLLGVVKVEGTLGDTGNVG